MLEVYPGSISLQRLDYLNSLTWMWYPTPSYSKVGVEKDIICIKMKKLMDLCYMSCKATIDSNDGEPFLVVFATQVIINISLIYLKLITFIQ